MPLITTVNFLELTIPKSDNYPGYVGGHFVLTGTVVVDVVG